MAKWAIAETDYTCEISSCNTPILVGDICVRFPISAVAACAACGNKFTKTWNLPTGTTVESKMITITSFGYKFGKPDGKIYDARKSVRNPWRYPTLRKLSGLHPDVQEFVMNCQGAQKLIKNITYAVQLGHTQNIAIGCHGGKHRSVAIAELLTAHLKIFGHEITVVHRELAQQNSE